MKFVRRAISSSGVSFVSILGKVVGFFFLGRRSGWSRAICFSRSFFQASNFIFFRATIRSFMTLLYTVGFDLAVRSSSFNASVMSSWADISSTSLNGSDDFRTSSLSLTISWCIRVTSWNLIACVAGGLDSFLGFKDSVLGSVRFRLTVPLVGSSASPSSLGFLGSLVAAPLVEVSR